MITFFSSTAWAAESVKVAASVSAWHAIADASAVVQLTILVLVAMSVISWAIMVQKRNQFRLIEQGNLPFEEKFWKATSLEEVYENLDEYSDSNMASVF